jgi:UDP-N-acetylglucosamine 2-epimerase (non-hydrolysing)/GDP/UDP-N,N'-diacetylbacillosamine 2-epimerase (hydrolysing)
MGEKEERIFDIGSIALDKFKNEEIFSKKEIFERLDIKKEFEKFAIVIFHPIPKERNISAQIFENILISLNSKDIKAFVSYPNIDPGNKEIIEVIEKYKESDNFIFYKNQPRKMFLSIYKNAEFIIGNSSSGILESASIPIGAINVGYRQRGRRANENLLFIDSSLEKIGEAIDFVTSKSFKEKLNLVKNIYGEGDSAQKAYELILNTNFKDYVFKDEDPLKVELI